MAASDNNQNISSGNGSKKIIIISLAAALAVTLLVIAVLLIVPNLGKQDEPSAIPSEDDIESSTAPSDEISEAEQSVEVSEDESQPDESSVPEEVSSELEKVTYTGWIINKMGYTYMYIDRGFEQFTGTSRHAKTYADAVSALGEKFVGANVYSIIVPTAAEYAYNDMPSDVKNEFFCQKQSFFDNAAAEAYSENIKSVSIVDLLGEHKDEYIYFNTDTNWTSLGSYYGYKAFTEVAGLNAILLEDCIEGVNEPYLGQFYACTSFDETDEGKKAAEALSGNRDKVYFHKIPGFENIKLSTGYKLTGNTFSNVRSGYYTFLGAESHQYDVTTGYSGGKLLIIGDASVAPMMQFLSYNYSAITYINIDRFEGGLDSFSGYDDVIIMNYATDAARSIYCERLISLMGEE